LFKIIYFKRLKQEFCDSDIAKTISKNIVNRRVHTHGNNNNNNNNNIRLLKIDKPQLKTEMIKVKVIHT